jgi:hypothetical protein
MKYARKRLSSNKNNQSILEKKDNKGKVTLLSNWSTTLNNDVFSLIARDQRLVNLSKIVSNSFLRKIQSVESLTSTNLQASQIPFSSKEL